MSKETYEIELWKSNEVLQNLYQYQKENVLCDVLIFTRTGCISAHRVVLAASSPYFQMFEEKTSGSNSNYSFPFDSSDTINIILKFLYTGKLKFYEDFSNEIAMICDALKLDQVLVLLKEKYGDKFDKKSSDSSSRVVQVSPFGTEHIYPSSSYVPNFPDMNKRDWAQNKAQNLSIKKEVVDRDSDNDSGKERKTSQKEDVPKSKAESDNKDKPDMYLYPASSNKDTVQSSDSEEDEKDEPKKKRQRLDLSKKKDDDSEKSDVGSEESSKEENSDNDYDPHDDDDSDEEWVIEEKKPPPKKKPVPKKAPVRRGPVAKSKKVKQKPPVKKKVTVKFKAKKRITTTKSKPTRQKKSSISSDKKSLVCVTCEEEFPDEETCLKHRKITHGYGETVYCDICNKYLLGKLRLIEHKFRLHGVLYDTEKYPRHKCEEPGCNYTNIIPARVREHFRNCHVRSEACPVCGKKFPKGAQIRKHVARHTAVSTLPCEVCGKLFRNKVTLATHIKDVHEKSTFAKKFLCHLCPVACRFRHEVHEHILKDHGEIPEGKEKQVKECPHCDYRTLKSVMLKMHLEVHQKELDPDSLPKTPCHVCGKLIRTRDFNHHVKNVHGERKHCPHEGCDFSTPNARNLRCHIYNMHTNKHSKPFSCHLCDHRCKLRGNLTKHLSKVHGIVEMSLPKKRQMALATGVNYPSTVAGNRLQDNSNTGIIDHTELMPRKRPLSSDMPGTNYPSTSSAPRQPDPRPMEPQMDNSHSIARKRQLALESGMNYMPPMPAHSHGQRLDDNLPQLQNLDLLARKRQESTGLLDLDLLARKRQLVYEAGVSYPSSVLGGRIHDNFGMPPNPDWCG